MDAVQIINISSTLGSISTLQGSLDAPEGSFPATLSHYHLAYRSSKAALNMREALDPLPEAAPCGSRAETVCAVMRLPVRRVATQTMRR